eukprot:TRINITY_DN2114_c3_g2_i2.p1 TRINITY_DN2114_c3_g2~~TRINITY_DN2114_c3_g2_i2.p1  ORF type:complete len:1083 (+),score=250.10 TRINITY_DN2114_c3_g2_i2:37-3249(+)
MVAMGKPRRPGLVRKGFKVPTSNKEGGAEKEPTGSTLQGIKPRVSSLRGNRKGFKPPGKLTKDQQQVTKSNTTPKAFYPATSGRTAAEIVRDNLKNKGLDDGKPMTKIRKVEEQASESSTEEEDEDPNSAQYDLPPAILEMRKKQESKKKKEEKKEKKSESQKGDDDDDSSSDSDSSSSSSSSSEEDLDELGNPREKIPRLPISHLSRLYFEAKVLNHSGQRHERKGIVVLDVPMCSGQLYDRTGKQFGNKPHPGYPISTDIRKVKMNDEIRLSTKLIRLGPAVHEEEFLGGAFFLRKNQKRRQIEKQRRRAEEKEIRKAVRGGSNHLSHTGKTAITYGTSMVSKSAGILSKFRPVQFKMYKPKNGFIMPKKKVDAQPTVPTQLFDPDAEKAVVLFRAEYKVDSARRPLVNVVVDPEIGDKLRPHQIIGVKFMWDCINGDRVAGHHGCILADEMGLGKSIQAIALLWTALQQGKHGTRIAKKAVIVAPSSLVQNWCNELEKWLEGKVQPCAIAQSTVKGERILNTYQYSQDRNVLVISYDQLRKYENRFKDMACIGLVICDEGHRLKNAEIKTTKAVDMIPTTRRVILSGTPLQNDLGEFHAMVNFCNPGVVGSITTFKTVFEAPIMIGREPICPEPEKVLGSSRAQYLATLTGKFILQRKQTINEKYLPPKIEQTVFIRPSKMQLSIYESIVKMYLEGCGDTDEDGKKCSPALVTITMLKKLCNHPDLIWEVLTDGRGKMSKLKKAFPSKYKIHASAPDCSGKLDFVQAMLTELKLMPVRTRDKVVIVSNYTQTLDVIGALCKMMNVGFFQLDGNTPIKKRQQLVDQFNVAGSPEIVFLLSSKAGGVGLNLIGANRLILYDPDWNPANDAQAMGRVWRDGQRKKVFIYRLLSTGTIEEKIYQRQVSKQGLSANVMDATDTSKQHFTNNELKALFELKYDTNCETHDLLGCRCKDQKKQKGNMAFKTHQRSGPRMDELKGWKHFTSPDEGNDQLLKKFGTKTVSFLFANERDSSTTKEGVEVSNGFADDVGAITCENDDDGSSEISLESDSEGDGGDDEESFSSEDSSDS